MEALHQTRVEAKVVHRGQPICQPVTNVEQMVQIRPRVIAATGAVAGALQRAGVADVFLVLHVDALVEVGPVQAPAWLQRWNAQATNPWTPTDSKSAASRDRTTARVASGRNAGRRRGPCAVSRIPDAPSAVMLVRVPLTGQKNQTTSA